MEPLPMLSQQMANDTLYPLLDGYVDYNDTFYYNEDCELVATGGLHEQLQSSSYSDSAAFGIVLDVWTFLINCIVIYACMVDKQTRVDPYYCQIVNFCVCNIIVSIFVIPLTIYYILHPWNLGRSLCTFYVVMDITLPFCSFIIVIILNIDRILASQVPSVYSGIFRKSLPQLIIIIPWITSFVIIVPLWTSGMITDFQFLPCECHIIVTTLVAVACPVLSYFIPLIVLIMLTLKLCVINMSAEESPATTACDRITLRQARSGDDHSTDSNDNPTDAFVSSRSRDYRHSADNVPSKGSLSAVCSITFIMGVMWFPFQCISVLMPLCGSQSCMPSIGLTQFVTWAGASSAGLAPLFFLLDVKLRKNLHFLLTKPSYTANLDERSRASVEVTYL